MEYEKRAMTEEEDKYTFRQSSQISGQCGLIGRLRADMGTDGVGFFSSWTDYRADLKTDEFKAELDEVINSLREEGDFLHSRADLARYCSSSPQSKMTTDREYYGVRVDTEKYAYLLRLNPNKGDNNLYCYCYRRDWLDSHLRQARKGIRFIDPSYKELFRIPDGEKIRILYSDGEKADCVCRYIDDYHLEVGDHLFYSAEFAERMQANGSKAIPLRSSLPERCYVYIPTENRIGIVQRGETGYFKTDVSFKDAEDAKQIVREQNEAMGVSKRQASAMVAGSMFGWETPAADPKNYDENGAAIKRKQRDSRDER